MLKELKEFEQKNKFSPYGNVFRSRQVLSFRNGDAPKMVFRKRRTQNAKYSSSNIFVTMLFSTI